jgi:hypothetical protein
MAQEEIHEENLSHEEIMYRYHIQRGMDFTKIELFRSARENYKEALKYKPGDPLAAERMVACNNQIKKDRVKVLVLVPIVLAIIVTVIVLNL